MSETDTPAEGSTPAATVEKEKPEEKPEAKSFDAEYVKKLRDEAAGHRKSKQELEAKLTEYEERDKSELEKLTGKLTKAQQDKADAESKLLRYEIAAEKQVPADAVDLLVGSTREELEAKADKLLDFVKNRDTNNRPDFDGGTRDPAPETKTPEDAHRELIGALFGVQNQT